MPQRSRTKTVYGGPQGKDAFVTVKKFTVDEGRAYNTRMEANRGNSDEQEQDAREALSEWVVEWNWVDEDNKPLPQPHKNAAVIGQLLTDELAWLGAVVNGNEEGEKKETKP